MHVCLPTLTPCVSIGMINPMKTASPIRWLQRLFGSTDYHLSSQYIAACQWAERYDQSLTPEAAKLALQHAIARLDDRIRGSLALENKFLDLLKFDATALAALFAIQQLRPAVLSAWLLAAFVCLVVSMLLCLRGRQADPAPVRATARDVLEGIGQADCPEAWLACSIHITVEAMQVTSETAANRYDFATKCTAAADRASRSSSNPFLLPSLPQRIAPVAFNLIPGKQVVVPDFASRMQPSTLHRLGDHFDRQPQSTGRIGSQQPFPIFNHDACHVPFPSAQCR